MQAPIGGKPGKCPGVMSNLGFHELSYWCNAGYAVPALRTTRFYAYKNYTMYDN